MPNINGNRFEEMVVSSWKITVLVRGNENLESWSCLKDL